MNWPKELAKRGIEAVIRSLPLSVQVLAKENPIEAPMNYGTLRIGVNSWFEYQVRRRLYEPTLVAWIEKMPPDAVFYDIGANVGNYTMIAARNKILTVAFEPSALNYASLVRNLELNRLANVYAFPIALSDRTGIQTFNYHKFIQGEGYNALGMALDYTGKPYLPCWTQAMLAWRLDDFLEENPELPPPTHIKIDVDGIEAKVLQGAKCTLQKVIGVMVEIENECEKERDIGAFLLSQGFRDHIVSRDYETCSNWFFTRDSK